MADGFHNEHRAQATPAARGIQGRSLGAGEHVAANRLLFYDCIVRALVDQIDYQEP